MVNFAQLRTVDTAPLIELTDQARRTATELEQFGSDTDVQRNALASSWAGADANAAIARIGKHGQDYRIHSGLYGRVDTIVTSLAHHLDTAKQRLESAVSMVPSIPGSIDGSGTITINYAALSPNPTPAAVQAAQARAQQVHGYLCQALQLANDADRRAQSELAGLIAPVDAANAQVAARQAENDEPAVGEEPQASDGPATAPAESEHTDQPDDASESDDEQQNSGATPPGQPGTPGGGDGGDGEGEPLPPAGVVPPPVGDLNEAQMSNAMRIIEVGEALGISEQGQAIALATAMQESNFRNLANDSLPASLDVPNEGVGSDHDSVGVFQQRPSQGWGSIEECMDVDYAASKFYEELQRVDGWENMELTEAAQAVQRSAYPDAYAKWETLAYDILGAARGD